MGLLQHARNITQAEAWGFLHAMQWAHRCQYKKVMFENDNLQVVNLLKSQKLYPPWQDACIINRCVSLLVQNPYWSCLYANRSCNKVADEMAKYVRKNNLARVLWFVCPSDFRTALEADYACTSLS